MSTTESGSDLADILDAAAILAQRESGQQKVAMMEAGDSAVMLSDVADNISQVDEPVAEEEGGRVGAGDNAHTIVECEPEILTFNEGSEVSALALENEVATVGTNYGDAVFETEAEDTEAEIGSELDGHNISSRLVTYDLGGEGTVTEIESEGIAGEMGSEGMAREMGSEETAGEMDSQVQVHEMGSEITAHVIENEMTALETERLELVMGDEVTVQEIESDGLLEMGSEVTAIGMEDEVTAIEIGSEVTACEMGSEVVTYEIGSEVMAYSEDTNLVSTDEMVILQGDDVVMDEQVITEEVFDECSDMMMTTDGELEEDTEQNVIMVESDVALMGNEEVIGEQEVAAGSEEVDIAAKLANEVMEQASVHDEEEKLIDSNDSEDSDQSKNSGKRPSSAASKLFRCPYCNFSEYNLETMHAHIADNHPQTGAHRCTECTYASEFDYGLTIHSVIHNSTTPYHCSMCSFKCNLDYQLNRHINHHTGEKQFKCDQCSYGTDHSTNYRRHIQRHNTNLGVSCQYCTYSCVNSYQLNRHVRCSHRDITSTHESSGQESKPVKVEPVQSVEMSVVDTDTSSLTVQPEQLTEAEVLRCDKCSFTTRYSDNMDKHSILHESGSTEQMSCDYCSYTTVIRNNLKRHCKSAHPEQMAEESDSLSPSTSAKRSAASGSKKPSQQLTSVSVKRDSEGMMRCEMCDYKTSWQTNLKRHYTTHEPKVCPVCSYTTMNRTLFIKHQRTHDEEDNSDSDAETNSISSNQQTEEYTCELPSCRYSTTSKTSWRQHLSEHGSQMSAKEDLSRESDNDEEGSPSKATSQVSSAPSRSSLNSSLGKAPDKFHCTQCDFSCNHDTWLETHMKQHAIGKTSHKCQYCGYTAPNPHRLKAHMMTHTGFKPYKCPRCDFASSNSSNLYRHIRKKHSPEDVELAKNQKIDTQPQSSEEEEDEGGGEDSEDERQREESATSRGSIPLVIFRCNECEFTTMSRELLAEHKEVHAIADLVEDADTDEEVQVEPVSNSPIAQSSEPQLEAIVKETTPRPTDLPLSVEGAQATTQKTTTPPSAKAVSDRRGKLPVWKVKLEEEKAKTEKKEVVSPGDTSVAKPSILNHSKYPCNLCTFTHAFNSSLSLHRNRQHFGGRPYICRMCVFRAQSMYQLNRHRWVCHSLRRCTLPPSRIDRSRKKRVRFRWKAKLTVTFACNRCDFDTTVLDDWGRHLNQHAKEQIKMLQERSPKSVHRKKEALQATPVDNIFTCSECDFTCRRKDMYTAHVKQHSRKAVVSKCDQCPYTTSNPYNLMKHKRTHTGEKPFKCSYCTYRSADSGNLNKHINSHHGVEGVKKRAILMMKKKAPKKPASPTNELVKPAAVVKAPSTTNARPPPVKLSSSETSQSSTLYKCTECEYKCANEDFLIAHLSIHKKQGDQYVCAICDYASRNQQNLAKHIRTHTGEKPYQCTQCHYSAADKGNLNKHIKTHHKKDEVEKAVTAPSVPEVSAPPPQMLGLPEKLEPLG